MSNFVWPFNQTSNHQTQHTMYNTSMQQTDQLQLCPVLNYFCCIAQWTKIGPGMGFLWLTKNNEESRGRSGEQDRNLNYPNFMLPSQHSLVNKKLLILPNLLFLLLANNRINEKRCQKKLFWIPIKMKIKLTWLFVTIKTIISQPENLVVVLLACSTKMMHPAGSLIPFACK